MKLGFRPASRMLALVCAWALSGVPATASGFPRPIPPGGRAGAPGGAITLSDGAAGTISPAATVITGTAWKSDNTPIPNARVRLRNVQTGKIEAATLADDAGRFKFTRIETGSYIVELVSEEGKVLSVGPTFALAPGESVSTVVRLGSKVPWFHGFFGNAASGLSTAAAGLGVTAVAPEAKQCASPPNCR